MIGPDMKPGWTAAADKICAKGVATVVGMDPATGMAAYSQQWGAGLAFDLAGMGGSDVKGVFNAVTAGIRGFMFDITTSTPPAPMTLRVNFTSQATGTGSHFVTVALPTLPNQEILFDDAFQGDWVATKVPIPKDQLEAVQFQVFTNATAAVPFDFCVSNMRVIK